jgi:predicted O-methyltransferase YrrM
MKLDTTHLVQWQRFDPTNGLIMPWFTHPFLEVLETWDLHNKRILEFGSGYSTMWWRQKSAYTVSIESNEEWASKIREYCEDYDLDRGEIHLAKFNEGSGLDKPYLATVPDKKYDIIIIDGIYRTRCCEWAIDYLKSHGGGIIIADNFNQSFVWVDPEALEIMAPYEMNAFIQQDHTDNDGILKWQTCFWKINSQ